MADIICVIGNKGGTGKTTISHMLCQGMGLLGQRSVCVLTDTCREPLDPAGRRYLVADARSREALTKVTSKIRSLKSWMGVIDGEGRAVSFIQSIYHEFGTGIVLKESGINWQNRGASFSLDPDALLVIKPGKKPFHTLNPAMALFNDGRVMPYGTMGGDGQPQTQSAVFTRYAVFGQGMQQAISAPRW